MTTNTAKPIKDDSYLANRLRFVQINFGECEENVKILMETQHIQNKEVEYLENLQSNSYKWLSVRKHNASYWMSTRDEIKIRNCLQKISQDQEHKVLKNILKFLDENPNVLPSKVPEITLYYLNNAITENFLKERITRNQNSHFSRMTSFRNSLRKLSIFSNAANDHQDDIQNNLLKVPNTGQKTKRSVSFSEEITVIYRAYNT